MKKLTFIFLLMVAVVHSQESKYEKIKALKTAYITEQLSLTSVEAEKFWPVYNTFETKFRDLRVSRKNEVQFKFESDISKLSDDEANKIIDQYMAMETAQLQIEKERLAALRKILSPQRLLALRKAEDSFKGELLRRYKMGNNENRPLNKGKD